MSDELKERLGEINELIKSKGDISDLPIREIYYLNNWYRYKENLKELDKNQLENARRLFRALKELSDEDRNFLATKFDRPTIWKGKNKVRPTDEMVAKEIGMTAKEYGNKRRTIQKKLKRIMQEQTD